MNHIWIEVCSAKSLFASRQQLSGGVDWMNTCWIVVCNLFQNLFDACCLELLKFPFNIKDSTDRVSVWLPCLPPPPPPPLSLSLSDLLHLWCPYSLQLEHWLPFLVVMLTLECFPCETMSGLWLLTISCVSVVAHVGSFTRARGGGGGGG